MNRTLIAVALSLATLSMVGCGSEPAQSANQQALQKIDVAPVLVKPVQNWHTYTTRLESPQIVALKPRVSGVIEQISFNEGDLVRQGDVLFSLDARPFVAVVASLEAQIKSAEAALEQAKSEALRAERLTERKAISTEQAESRQSILRQREAQLAALHAELDAAKLDLEFSQVRSPIDGVISRANITKGNNVTAAQSILTTIVSNKKMYGYFDIDERTWNQSFSEVDSHSALPVVMQSLGARQFSHQGKIDFIDNQIDQATGTLRIRAVFENSNNQLRAGSFARIKLAANDVQEQVIIPAKAVGTDLKNRFVLTVGENNVLQYKQVTLGERYGSLRAVTSGLMQGDVIAVNGPARVGPGMPIEPSTVSIDSEGIVFTVADTSSQLIAKQ